MANALRTIPALREIAEVVSKTAPDAWMLNMVAPLGVTTRFLLGAGLRAIGVCELPAVTEKRLLAAARFPPQTRLHYAGYNHLGWFWAEGNTGIELARTSSQAGLGDAGTIEQFGAIPLRYYYEIFEPEKAERLGFHRSPARASELNYIAERLFTSFSARDTTDRVTFDERPTPWFDEALVPIIESLTAGAVYDGFINLRNENRLPVAPENTVVEVRARIVGHTLETFGGDKLPPKVAAFLAAVGRSEELVYTAALASNANDKKRAIASAIEALPLPGIAGKPDELVCEIIASAEK
jgi:6-phospho-beta-glucosidase